MGRRQRTGTSSSSAPTVGSSPAIPIEASLGEADRVLDAISTAQLLASPSLQGNVIDITLPNGNTALATSQLIKSLPGQVIVIQERLEPLWGSDSALSVTLSATTGFVVLILGFAFHWQSTRAREGDLINDAVRGRIDTALNRGRCGLWDWDLSRGRIFWSQSMFTMLGLDSRSDLLTFGEVNALVKSDDIDLFAIADQLISGELDHIDQTFRMQHTDGHWIWLRVRCELSQGSSDSGAAPDRDRGRHHRTEEPCRKDRRGRPAAARRDRDHPGSLRAVGRDRPPGALQLALPAAAQAARPRRHSRHVLRDRARGRPHARGAHPSQRDRKPRAPGARTFEAQLDDGSWLHISERRTKDGGYVSVGTDITRIKEHEQKLVDNDLRLRATVIDLKRSQAALERQAIELADLAEKYRARRPAPRKPTRPSRSSSPI